ncbi:MAG: hypothetical protein R3Y19_00655 [Rikenellaceae bacterium]
MKRYILILLALVTLEGMAHGQTTQSKISELMINSGNGRVSVELDSRSRAAISRSSTTEKIAVYSINILNSSAQNGRQLADEAIKALNQNFPDLSGEWLYQAPVFKAICGHWLTRADATAVLYRLRTIFPAAFIFNNTVEIEKLLVKHDVPSIDSLPRVLTNEDPEL